ncbi:MAG: metal-dependent hydrolase [Patescibacteria group bacterium]
MQEAVVNEWEEKHAEELRQKHVPIAAYWFDHNALITILFNTASITIPDAERFVIRAVEAARPQVTEPHLEAAVQNILEEERAHARVHDAYNEYLARHGYPVAHYARKVQKSTAFFDRHCSVVTRLALCAMTEHFTACGARQILDSGIFEGRGVDERMDRVWTWHALEELDHRATAFDLYRAQGGGYGRRVWAGIMASAVMLYIHFSCTLSLARKQHLLWDRRAWRVALPFLIGPRGIYYRFISDWFKFFLPSFHPNTFPLRNLLKKQLHHYHIESELVAYFRSA